jgi:hypothetical protein
MPNKLFQSQVHSSCCLIIVVILVWLLIYVMAFNKFHFNSNHVMSGIRYYFDEMVVSTTLVVAISPVLSIYNV